jgi:hypothetical protein
LLRLLTLVGRYSSPLLLVVGGEVRHNRRNKLRVTAVVKLSISAVSDLRELKHVPLSIHATKDKPKSLWAAVRLEFPTIANHCGPKVTIEVNFRLWSLCFIRTYLEKCEANYRNAEADVENIERWVRTSDGANLSQPVTLFVDVTSQYHLCVVQEEQDNATNLK